ncbi:MAG: hypothetical protein LC099_00995 [Anaerolineales bacterium]|nr:hypothetical protein [Anaerolineales bacterium]
MKPFQILLAISFLLTACAPRTTAASTPPAQATVASTPLSTETPPVENTKIVPTPTEKAKTIEELAADILAGETVDTSALTLEQQAALDAALAKQGATMMGELVQKFLAGEIGDISFLPFKQRKEFSTALVAERRAWRGDIVITYNGEAYIHPETFKMMSVNDGSSAKERAMIIDYPAVRDDEGYLHIFYGDEWVKIPNSKDVKFAVTDDPHDPDINWPTTEKLGADRGELAGLTIMQVALAKTEQPAVMLPIVVLDLLETPGEIMIRGYGRKQGTLPALIIKTDASGNPVSAELMISTGVGRLYKEGSNLQAGGEFDERSVLWRELNSNTLYYMIFYSDQAQGFDGRYIQGSGEVTTGYSGFVPSSQSFKVVTGEQQDKRMVWIDGRLMMEAGNE